MIVRDISELAELHNGLRRVATSKHADAKWAQVRLQSLTEGTPLDDRDAVRIRAAEFEAFGIPNRPQGARQTIQLESDDPPARRVRVAVGKDVIA